MSAPCKYFLHGCAGRAVCFGCRVHGDAFRGKRTGARWMIFSRPWRIGRTPGRLWKSGSGTARERERLKPPKAELEALIHRISKSRSFNRLVKNVRSNLRWALRAPSSRLRRRPARSARASRESDALDSALRTVCLTRLAHQADLGGGQAETRKTGPG